MQENSKALSQYKIGEEWEISRSQHKKEHHFKSTEAYPMDLYSDFALDLDTIVCFLEDHIIKLLPRNIHIPITNFYH